MTILFSHSTEFDYQKELYKTIRTSDLGQEYTILFPYETDNMPYEIKAFLKSGKCDLLVAECSSPSLGVGMEIGWANMAGVDIMCLSKKGSPASAALKMVSDYFLEYEEEKDMLKQLKKAFASYQNLINKREKNTA